jgi:hypothetical protein
MIRTEKRLRLCAVLIVVNLCVIWGNSLLPGEISGAISDFVRDGLRSLLALLGHELGVAQCVLNIEKFLVCHLPLVLSKFFITFCDDTIICFPRRNKRGKCCYPRNKKAAPEKSSGAGNFMLFCS